MHCLRILRSTLTFCNIQFFFLANNSLKRQKAKMSLSLSQHVTTPLSCLLLTALCLVVTTEHMQL